MTADDIRVLKERLQAEWFLKKTEVFDDDYQSMEVTRMMFKEYWDMWLRDDIKDLFQHVQDLEKLKDRVRMLEMEIEEIENSQRP